MLMRRCFLALLVLCFTACASFKPPVLDGRLTPAEGQGLAIIALTANSFNNDSASATLRVNGINGSFSLYTRLVTDFIRAPGNTPNSIGRLFVFPLLPGEYRVVLASGEWRRDSSNLLSMFQYVDVPMNSPFKIKAGEVVYLGEVNLNMNFASDVILRQNTQRDFFDLQVRSGVTDVSNIAIRPLQAQTVQ